MDFSLDNIELNTSYPLLHLSRSNIQTGPVGPTGPAGPVGPVGPAGSSSSLTGSTMWVQMYLHRLSSGSTGGTLTDSVWTTRVLNATGGGNLHNRFTVLSNNQIFFVPGSYYIEISSVCRDSAACKLRLFDTVNNSTLVNGLNYYYDLPDTVGIIRANGGFTATGIAVTEVQIFTNGTTPPADALGKSGGFTNAEHEVFTTVKIFKRS